MKYWKIFTPSPEIFRSFEKYLFSLGYDWINNKPQFQIINRDDYSFIVVSDDGFIYTHEIKGNEILTDVSVLKKISPKIKIGEYEVIVIDAGIKLVVKKFRGTS